MDTIFAPRSSHPGEATFVLPFRGYRISISLDDSHLGRRLFRSYLAVYSEIGPEAGQDVTMQFAAGLKTEGGSIVNVEGETIFKIMQAIAERVPAETAATST